MCIDDKLEEIKPFLVSLRYSGGMPIMDVEFKKNWEVPNSQFIKAQKYDELPNTFMFYSDKEGATMDDLVTYIVKVISLNVEREEKIRLYQIKVNQLQEFFGEHDLEDLKKMEFTIPTNSNDWAASTLKDVPSYSTVEDEVEEIEPDAPEMENEEVEEIKEG
jgi:hypothetical protein